MTKAAFTFALLCACAVATAGTAGAAAAAPGTLAVPALSAAPPLDPHRPATDWSQAAPVPMPWDVTHQKSASERSEARIGTDGANVYVRFDVDQREGLLAQQHTNDVGDGTDDEVWIDLWPNGSSGFFYQFAATSNGTHFQYSSENTAYAPTWESYGAVRDGGWTVTMRIPLRVMRGSGGSAWKAQFVRVIRSTGERQIWSYAPAQTNGDDVTFAGSLAGIAPAVAARPSPRFALYGLGSAGSSASGLTTSRTGADVSIPITATSSVFATFHPDFSNVEIDQQTISPTAYQRSFSEVRPFFTQSANYFDGFDCAACPYTAQLYTPGIPTPREGYALEGKQGRFTFAAFDALGVSRADGAGAISYRTPDNHWRFTAQSVSANLPGITDHVDTTGVSYNDSTHVSGYFNYGSDHGSNVKDGAQAQRYDVGTFLYSSTFGFAASARKAGAYYQPVDGFVQHADIAGYALYADKIFLLAPNSFLNSIQLAGNVDRYHGHTGGLNQTDNSLTLDFLTRSRIDLQGSIGSSYLLLDNGIFTPITQNGVSAMWHSGTVNNPGNGGSHGPSSTPTMLSYATGRFGPGRVDSWTRSSTMRAGTRATLSLEADDTRNYGDDHRISTEWLEKLGYTYATGANSSFAVGIRRIIGTPPLLDFTQPPSATNAYNLSFAFHRRLPHDELYVAYGDASQLATSPQFLLKLIHYFGAEKGT